MAVGKHLGHHSIYGSWDDVTDNQFLVFWLEAGELCTVFLLSGYDYGGGISSFSEKVPIKELKKILDKYDWEGYELKHDVTELVS